MKRIMYFFIFTLLVGCNNEVPNKPGNVVQTDNNLYFGKLVLNDSSKSALQELVRYKTYKFEVLIGCECDEEVGDYTNKKSKDADEKKSSASTVKQMEIADFVLDSLQHIEKEYLDHIFVKYRKVSGTTSTETPIIVGFKIDLLDKTKLEKVTVYTAKSAHNKSDAEPERFNTLVKQESEPTVDTVLSKLDTNNVHYDTASIRSKKKPR